MGILRRKKKGDRDLHGIVGGGEIPSFPQATGRILSRLRCPDASIEEVAEALQWDAGLVLQVLRTVNSAAYGTAARIEDVQHAAAYLGRSQLEQLVLAIAVKNCLPAQSAPGFRRDRFWRAAAFRAALGRALARELHPARQAEAFTSGLLQDLAVPVLAHARPEEYGKVLERWHDGDPARLDELEREVFGWCHGQVGGMLAREWELPDALVGSIEHHHSETLGDDQLLPSTRLVSILRETGHAGVEALVEAARADYGLDPDWTVETVEACEFQAKELAGNLFAQGASTTSRPGS